METTSQPATDFGVLSAIHVLLDCKDEVASALHLESIYYAVDLTSLSLFVLYVCV